MTSREELLERSSEITAGSLYECGDGDDDSGGGGRYDSVCDDEGEEDDVYDNEDTFEDEEEDYYEPVECRAAAAAATAATGGGEANSAFDPEGPENFYDMSISDDDESEAAAAAAAIRAKTTSAPPESRPVVYSRNSFGRYSFMHSLQERQTCPRSAELCPKIGWTTTR